MKQLMILFLALGLFSGAFAQKKSVEARAQEKVDEMTAELGLSKEQQTAILAIQIQKYTEYDQIKAENAGDKEAAKAAKKVAKSKYKKQVKALLTPEQIEKKKALKAKEKGGKGKKKGKKALTIEEKAVKKTNELDTIVTLSPEQRPKVIALYTKKYQDYQALEKQAITPEELKEQKKAAKKTFKKDLKKVLTDEQNATWKASKAEKKDKEGADDSDE